MTLKDKPPVLVVLQLTGGNDYFNSVIPYTDSNYYDNRPSLQVPEDDVLKLDDELGLHPTMGPLKEIYEQGTWLSSTVSVMRTLPGLISGPWISGIPASPIRSAPRDG